jgi:hypothetical protein
VPLVAQCDTVFARPFESARFDVVASAG